MDATPRIALAHDYLTQRGGAERVVLALTRAFPEAPLYTSFYEPSATFAEFGGVDVHTLLLNAIAPLRQNHRLAFPLLAPAFSRLTIDADVTVCSSSGWAHGAHVTGRKIVYCHAPARWLYQSNRYLGDASLLARVALAAMRRPLLHWDRKAARSADRYLANSTWIARAIAETYGIEAEVLHPPTTIDVAGAQQPFESIEPGYVLCVSRLLPYKNVDAAVAAFETLTNQRLVVVGDGPDETRLRRIAGTNVAFAGSVADAQLRWLYANAKCLVTASYEDFGLTPLEAAAFGKPTAALRFGGFLDTVADGETGILFDRPEPDNVARALTIMLARTWDDQRLREHAASFSEERFGRRLREITAEELAVGSLSVQGRLSRHSATLAGS
jgi:glycosyltransferase involved in cell wall biosynthesis